jgi:nitronate monooxygenase
MSSPDRALSQELLIAAHVLRRPVCDLLGCDFPLVLAGMGGVARSELVCAVTTAGGFGFLGMVREPVALIREEVRKVRACTDRKFGINLIPAATAPHLLAAQIDACLGLRVPVVALFWDLSATIVQRLRDAGVCVVCQVGSVQEAEQAQEAGAELLIVQGREAGGHVRGLRPLWELLPEVLVSARVPVLAAGGLSNGADVAAVMALGAQGGVLGTAMIATHESFAHEVHKQRIVEAGPDQTTLTEAFHINWPPHARVRVLRNSVTRGEHGDPFDGRRTVIGEEEGRPIHLFSTDSPLRSMTGDFEAMALYAGKGVERIHAVIGAQERLQCIAMEAAVAMRARESGSGVHLSAGPDWPREAHADRGERLASLNELLEAERAGARVTLESVGQTDDPDLQRLLTHIHHDEVKWCGVLIHAIRSAGATPSTRTGAFYDKAMAVADPAARLALLNRGQGWVARKLREVLARVHDTRIRGELEAMLANHESNVERVDAQLGRAPTPNRGSNASC